MRYRGGERAAAAAQALPREAADNRALNRGGGVCFRVACGRYCLAAPQDPSRQPHRPPGPSPVAVSAVTADEATAERSVRRGRERASLQAHSM
jgi:hypothetical protein